MSKLNKFDAVSSLLDTDLTELADLPEFKTPPAGRYIMSVIASSKDDAGNDKMVNSHPAIGLDYTVVEIKELADPEAAAPALGDKFGEVFMLDNEFGVGKLKKALRPYAEAIGCTNIGDLLAAIDGLVIEGTIKVRTDKEKVNDDGTPKTYGSVVAVAVL